MSQHELGRREDVVAEVMFSDAEHLEAGLFGCDGLSGDRVQSTGLASRRRAIGEWEVITQTDHAVVDHSASLRTGSPPAHSDEAGLGSWSSRPEERRHPSLHTVLVHMTIETARHAGHLDILRELIDGEAGRFAGDRSVPSSDELDWAGYVAKVQAAALVAQAASLSKE